MKKQNLNWFQNVEHRTHPHPGLNWLTATISVPDVARALDFYTGIMEMVSISELEDEKIAVIEIGDSQMQAIVTQNGQILYKQETAVSNDQLIQLIQRTYQLSEEQAETMKNTQDKPADYQSQIADRFNIQVAQEVQRVLQFYYTTQPSDQFSSVRHIFLTGSASQQIGLAETVFSQTNTASQCVSPVTYTDNSNSVDLSQLQQDAASLTIAFGLALRGL